MSGYVCLFSCLSLPDFVFLSVCFYLLLSICLFSFCFLSECRSGLIIVSISTVCCSRLLFQSFCLFLLSVYHKPRFAVFLCFCRFPVCLSFFFLVILSFSFSLSDDTLSSLICHSLRLSFFPRLFDGLVFLSISRYVFLDMSIFLSLSFDLFFFFSLFVSLDIFFVSFCIGLSPFFWSVFFSLSLSKGYFFTTLSY